MPLSHHKCFLPQAAWPGSQIHSIRDLPPCSLPSGTTLQHSMLAMLPSSLFHSTLLHPGHKRRKTIVWICHQNAHGGWPCKLWISPLITLNLYSTSICLHFYYFLNYMSAWSAAEILHRELGAHVGVHLVDDVSIVDSHLQEPKKDFTTSWWTSSENNSMPSSDPSDPLQGYGHCSRGPFRGDVLVAET